MGETTRSAPHRGVRWVPTSRPERRIAVGAERRVSEVLAFEDLPIGSSGTRRAVVRWTDGSEGEACRWFSDEILVCEGDLVGKSEREIRQLHFRRDRDWLQS
ncbi:MAG: hypothetical protein QOK07_3364 [Gemmatimonadaceae bacterium]|nr:hypothetical protein [Gemmatimonadaceae bacterium]